MSGQTQAGTRGSGGGVPAGGPDQPVPAVVCFAKAPVPGSVKTRLCPPLRPVEAAALHAAFVCQSAATLGAAGARTFLYGWPADRLDDLRALVPPEVEVRPQRGEGLWARMAACFAELFGEGFAPVVIRNSDSPDLPAARVQEALARSQSGTVILGPDLGGGYYLIALREPLPELSSLLAAASEGAGDACARTAERARELGLAVHLLPAERDVDTFADLLALWRARLE